MDSPKDYKSEIGEIQNRLLDIFSKLQNDEISAKEANVVRRESNKQLKTILKALKERQAEGNSSSFE